MKAIVLFALMNLALGQNWEAWTCRSGIMTITPPTPTQFYSASQVDNLATSSLLIIPSAFPNQTAISVTTSQTLSLFSVAKPTNSSGTNVISATAPKSTAGCVSSTNGGVCSSTDVLSNVTSFTNIAETASTSRVNVFNTIIVSPTAVGPSSTAVLPSLATGAAGQNLTPTFPMFSRIPSWPSTTVFAAALLSLIAPAVEAGIWEL